MSGAISGGSGGGLGKAFGILALVIIGLVVLAGLMRGLATGVPQNQALATATPTIHCPTYDEGVPVFIVHLSRSKYPEATQHIDDARQLKGKPWVLTLDRPGATQRRQQALAGWPPKSGFARDEYPPALALEGGKGADIRYINPSDNSGAGATMGNAVNGPPYQPDETKFCLELVP